ncbi:MAG: tetratricopeptide repeat protein [Acidobacteriota bacterium]
MSRPPRNNGTAPRVQRDNRGLTGTRAVSSLLLAVVPLGCEPGAPGAKMQRTERPAAANPVAGSTSWSMTETEIETLDPRLADRLRRALAAASREPTGPRFGALGRTYHAHNFIERARLAYARASELDPGASEWHYYVGLLAAERGELTIAIRAFERARELGDQRPIVLDRLARAQLAAGELERARRVFEELRGALPARSALGLARVELQVGELEAALRHLQRASKREPRDRVAAYLLGTTLQRLGRESEAKGVLARVADLEEVKPKDALVEALYAYRADLESLLRRGGALLERGDVAGAEKLYREILAVDSQHADALFNLGVLLGRTERFAEAESVLARAVEAAPERTDTRLMLAMSFASQGRIDEARAALERLLEIDPGNERALQLLASRPE